MRFVCERDSVYTCMQVIKLLKEGKILISSIQVKKQSVAVIQMVWNGRVSAHDFYETTRIFYEKDDFSFSDTGDSEGKNPSFPKG